MCVPVTGLDKGHFHFRQLAGRINKLQLAWRAAMASAPEALGRKRRTDIWKHFCYNSSEKKTLCTVTENGEKPCGYKIGGKNATNFKRCLKACHPAIYAASVTENFRRLAFVHAAHQRLDNEF
ncbi:hypothetical protein QTP70_033869 [Hemibagrus guttatus]|uniref:Uncharacterized protein n=1 Tax=Hemibagrus guttatus TaxID=175788 RepID=A0AAE0QME1_9TELE|nr:hypothetical protein QTP70_033869 [Hemibagrus guttatus]